MKLVEFVFVELEMANIMLKIIEIIPPIYLTLISYFEVKIGEIICDSNGVEENMFNWILLCPVFVRQIKRKKTKVVRTRESRTILGQKLII